MSTAHAAPEGSFDIEYGLAEFAELDRRRLFGSPALEVSEVEYWLELRASLELHLARENAVAAPDAPEPALPGVDRREFIRLPTHIRIQVSEPANVEPQIARDISQGGLFIATRRPLEVGSEVCLELERDGQTIEVRGCIAWAQAEDSRERSAGMGVRFDTLEPEERSALSRFVQDLAFED